MEILLYLLLIPACLVGLIFWMCWPDKDEVDTNPFS